MELFDIPAVYLVVAVSIWFGSFFWLVQHPEWIGAFVLGFFFFMPAALDLVLGGRSIPTGQIVILFFLPPLITSLIFRQARVSWFDLGLLLSYGMCILVSILLNDLPLWSNKSALVPVLFAIVLYLSIDSKEALYNLFLVYALLILVNTIFAGLQRAGFNWAYLASEQYLADAGGYRRGVGLSGHFAMAGLYAAVTVPVAAALFLDAHQRYRRTGAFLLGLLGLAGIAFAVLRAALLGALLGILNVVWHRRSLRAFGSLAILSVLMMIIIVVVPPLRDAAESMITHTVHADSSSEARPRLARMGLGAWALSPVLGGGPSAVDRFVQHNADPHNTFVNVLAETGVVGLVIFLLIILRGYIQSIRALRRGYATEGIALAGALVATLPIAFFHSLNYIILFWFTPALCLALGHLPSRRRVRTKSNIRVAVVETSTAS